MGHRFARLCTQPRNLMPRRDLLFCMNLQYN